MQKKMDHKQELLVWGYVRELEKVYKFSNIPHEINDIIYSYQRLCDQWSEKHSDEHLKLNADKSIVTCQGNHEVSTAYGDTKVEQGIFEWRIKILSLTRPKPTSVHMHVAGPFVGIIEDESVL